jgi:uncharacterized repeat protein (TIGR04138 family)
MQSLIFEQVLDVILAANPRYQRDAYYFLREALDYTQRMAAKAQKGEIRHVSGGELLEGIRRYGLEQFGPMTMTVFESWGVRTCEDFGEIVFILVESNLLAKTEKDSRDDFKSGYNFYDAFCVPFLPASRKTPGGPKALKV